VPSKEIIGVVRVRRGAGYYKMERVCVSAGHRRYGFGGALVTAAHDWALADTRASPITVVVHSQLPAKALYKRFGYEELGEEFDEEASDY